MNHLPASLKSMAAFAGMLLIAVLQGCATAPADNSAAVLRPIDPYERFNRTIFTFNENLDRTVVKPVASTYRDITPAPIRKGVTNFFGNISDMLSFLNTALQLKPAEATDNLFRVTVNTFWGIGGIFDVASEMNIPRHSEDFGQTLGYWGIKSGPYLVLPALGPSTLRDSFGRLVDVAVDPVSSLGNVAGRNSLTGLRLVDTRANFLSAGDVLDQAALDKYTFSREIYLQRRRALIGSDTQEKEERYDLPESASPADAPAKPAPPQ